MKKRWICLYVENDVGVLARISGLFSGKSYNLNSLTVGTTEDESVSRMIISLTSDDTTFEQIKKQLNRSIEVIKVVDYTDIALHMKELMFVKVTCCSEKDKAEIFKIAQVFEIKIIDFDMSNVLLESVQTESRKQLVFQKIGSRVCPTWAQSYGVEVPRVWVDTFDREIYF